MAALALHLLRPLHQLSPVRTLRHPLHPPLVEARLQVLRRPVSRSCAGPQGHPPPPAPCRPAERPACRPRPPADVPRGVRVVCCAPPQGARPPCNPLAPAPPRTCADRTGVARIVQCAGARREGSAESGRCGAGQDRVACRLSAARDARRADYEREAARRTLAPPVGAPRYALGEDRVCTRATDGREYALPCAPAPAPRCVPLRADDACRVSDGRADPCANRPRVFVEIDRGATPPPSPDSRIRPPAPVTIARCGRTTTQSLTSRIVDGLGRARNSPGLGAPGGDSRRDRRLHTSAAAAASARPEPVGAAPGGLEAALRARGELAAAGRGRVAGRGAGAGSAPTAPPAGRLELPVPIGADRVTVHVALKLDGGAALPTRPTPPPPRADSPSAGNDSWLSIKTIQKRFAGCRRSDNEGRGREGARPPSPCAPKRPAAGGGASPCAPKRPAAGGGASPCAPKRPAAGGGASPCAGGGGALPASPRPWPCASPRTIDPKKDPPCADKKLTNIQKCLSTLTLLSNTS